MDENKRTLPRHIDGRIKIGPMPFTNFLKFLPFLFGGVFIMLSCFNPVTLFLGTLLILFIACLFSEFNNRETGLDILKDIIRYKREGDIIFERSCSNIADSKRIIRNEIQE